MSDLTHLLIARAVGPTAESESLEIRMGFAKEPDPEHVEEFRSRLVGAYVDTFGSLDPEEVRIGVAVLPWVDATDDPDGEAEDDDDTPGYLRFNEPDDPEWDAGWPPQ